MTRNIIFSQKKTLTGTIEHLLCVKHCAKYGFPMYSFIILHKPHFTDEEIQVKRD